MRPIHRLDVPSEVLTFLRELSDRDVVQASDRLVGDLQIDGDDLSFTLTAWIEDFYGVTVSSGDTRHVITVADLIAMIERLLTRSDPGPSHRECNPDSPPALPPGTVR